MKKLVMMTICLVLMISGLTMAETVQHPSLFFTIDELDEIREKVQDGWLRGEYLGVKREADRLLNASTNLNVSQTLARRLSGTINILALVGYIEEDERYIQKAIDVMMHNAENYDPMFYHRLNTLLALGDANHAFAVGYDWLYPYMTDSQREFMRNVLEGFGATQYRYSFQRYGTPSSFHDSSNWNGVANGGLGLTALVLGDKDEWLDFATRQVRAYFQYSTDADGWNYEGRGYWSYGEWGALTFAAALQNVTGIDLVSEQPKMATVTVDFLVRQMPPWGGGRVPIESMYLISKYSDQVGLWGLLNGNRSASNRSFPYVILWADPDLEPLSPKEANLSLDKFFESDHVLLRDGWDDLSAYVTFHSGFTRHSGHRMRKDNSFTFYALGERFAISPREARTRMEVVHNLVMVDEPRTTRWAAEFPYSAEITDQRTMDDAVYIKSDASNSVVYFKQPDAGRQPHNAQTMKVEEAQRQILFVRQPAGVAQPYLVVIDDLSKYAGEDPSTFSWLLHTEPRNTIEVLDNGAIITGNRRGALLHLDFLYPSDVHVRPLDLSNLREIKRRESSIPRIQRTLTGEIQGTDVRIIALLIASESDQEKPLIAYVGTEYDGKVTITFADGTIDTIIITQDNIEFSREK